MQMGFVGDLWSPIWQSVTGEAKAEKKNVTVVSTAISHRSKKIKV